MGPSHRAAASAWWLGGVLLLNEAGAGIHPGVALVGALVAPVFGAGRLSPDADVTWLAHLGHRQATHRPRTACWLTLGTGLVWALARGWLELAGATGLLLLLPLLWAPVTGWWSHLVGDAVFGRIPLGRRSGALALRLLGRRLVSPSRGRQAYWIGLGLDTDGLLERGNRMSQERNARGLRKTRNVLHGLHPMTTALELATLLLVALVLVQWAASHPLPTS